MNVSPDLIHELAASRPAAPPVLRARVRELAGREPARSGWSWRRLDLRRVALVAAPAAVALALVSAGAIGLSRSDDATVITDEGRVESFSGEPPVAVPRGRTLPATPAATDRARRISATLTVEVDDSDSVARATQQALDVTRALGGYVVSSTVTTGQNAAGTMTLRVPVGNVQRAIAQLSALGEIVAQQVQVEDLQQTLDGLRARRASLAAQIARITARLESDALDAETRAALVARRQTLRSELRAVRGSLTATSSEARTATLQLTIATPEVLGTSIPQSRVDRTLAEALNVLAWEGVVALAVAIVAAPFLLLALVAWLGRRAYRRHEDERLLAA